MKKNSIILLIAALFSSPLFSCQMIVTNTTRDAILTILDERSEQTVQAFEGQAVKGNTDPDQHAHLLITITHADYEPRVYKLTQFACSKSHEIPVTSTQIIHGLEKLKMPDDMDVDQLFKIEQVK